MVESKAVSSKMSETQAKELRKKSFRALHIVSIVDQVGPLYLKEGKQKTKGQYFDRIDQLTVSD